MKKIGVISLALCLMGCSTALPGNERDLSSFVPQEKKRLSGEEMGAFAAENFPGNCEWFVLEDVSDGDTIVLEDGSRVRFVGIDTPETVHPSKPVQYCGQEASLWTKKVFKGAKRVCLIYDGLSDDLDKYGRRLAYPFTEEGIDTTKELLKQGLARGYFGFPFLRKDEFRFYHNQAKADKKGVWSKRADVKECELVN